MNDFDAQVDEWIAKSERRIEAVFKIATQELFYGVLKPAREGGRMRIDTGFLRSSFQASIGQPVLRLEPRPDGEASFTPDTGAISLTINQADLGQTIFGMFTANYARPREYGSRGKPGDGFVLTNAARWQSFVNDAATTFRASI
ncbi:HK97 gp10 family phage protein [Litorimonas haliclonae]|uniref:HK97 gp10 family phage protein n=1 Tax=Litorimonas haliclonae TaxID=2081977 RepID=UPI0039EF62DC